jgi:hypothetical protein
MLTSQAGQRGVPESLQRPPYQSQIDRASLQHSRSTGFSICTTPPFAVWIVSFWKAQDPACTCLPSSPVQSLHIPPLYSVPHPVATASLSTMATAVASHNIGLWQDRREPSMHLPNMHLNNVMPPYYAPPNFANAPVSREYQPASNHMDVNVSLYSTNTLTRSVPYQAGAFVCAAPTTVPVSLHDMQQTPYCLPQMPCLVSYTQSPDMQPAHAPSNMFSPNIKSEDTPSPQSDQMYAIPLYVTESKLFTSEPTEGSGSNFATDVDTLMRAIQAKQTHPPQGNEQKACHLPSRFQDQRC